MAKTTTADTGASPEPAAAGPMPNPMVVMKVLKNQYNTWIAAGGTPSIYAGAAPTNSVAPHVSGSTSVGSVLFCTTGSWTGQPDSYAYQWKSAAANVGANSPNYTTVAGDSGKAVGCVVSAHNFWGETAAALSNTIAVP